MKRRSLRQRRFVGALAGIRKVHRLMRLPNPAEDEEVLLAMRRALRTKPRRPKQAYGLTKKLRDKLIAACPNDLLGIRNRALIAVGYDTLCRRSTRETFERPACRMMAPATAAKFNTRAATIASIEKIFSGFPDQRHKIEMIISAAQVPSFVGLTPP